MKLRGLLLRRDQLAVDQAFRDLHGVERRALAQVIRHAPKNQTVIDRRVRADTADIGGVFACGFIGRHVATGLAFVDHKAARRIAQDIACFIFRDRILEFDVDRFRVADEHRHAHAGRGHFDFGIKNFLVSIIIFHSSLV